MKWIVAGSKQEAEDYIKEKDLVKSECNIISDEKQIQDARMVRRDVVFVNFGNTSQSLLSAVMVRIDYSLKIKTKGVK